MTAKEIRSYLEAQRMEREEKNFLCYLQSVYLREDFATIVQNAFGKSKKAEFRKEPMRLTPLTEKEKEEQEGKELKRLVAYLDGFKKDFDKKEVTR